MNIKDTESIAGKMGDLVIGHKSGTKCMDNILKDIDEKVREAEKRLSDQEMKRSHAKEECHRMDEKVKLARMKLDVSKQQMLKQKELFQFHQDKLKSLNEAIDTEKRQSESIYDDFRHKVQEIKAEFWSLKIDPAEYDPFGELQLIQNEMNDKKNQIHVINAECADLEKQLEEMNCIVNVYPANLSKADALQVLDLQEKDEKMLMQHKDSILEKIENLKRQIAVGRSNLSSTAN